MYYTRHDRCCEMDGIAHTNDNEFTVDFNQVLLARNNTDMYIIQLKLFKDHSLKEIACNFAG